jgi:type II secretory pathway pseudopilin PulG
MTPPSSNSRFKLLKYVRCSHCVESRRRDSAVTPLAFTLLEVILALAILAGSMAALGEVMQLAHRNATMAEAETQAQILAASLMDEFASGSRKLDVADQQTIDDKSDPPWVYSVAIENSNIEELVAVHLRVEQQMDARLQPASFELVRWMPNPNNASSESSESSKSSSEGSSTSNSSTTTSGGTK